MYILITPAKNEQESLPLVADSILKQSILPKLWIIVDDGSVDRTPDIINELTANHNWIRSLRLPPLPRDITFHYSFICKQGFDYSVKYCNENQIKFNFIGLLDADTILEEKYFEKLIQELNQNKSLGIVSGGIYYNINGYLKYIEARENLPAGTGRLWRKDCFFDTHGYSVEPSPDSISNIKAMLRGWKTQQFKNIIAIQTRQTCSAEGLWKGYLIDGKNAYYLNKHPLLVVLNTIFFLTQKPYYIGIPFLYGYIGAVLHRERKIEDTEIKEYYWKNRIREYLPHLLNFK